MKGGRRSSDSFSAVALVLLLVLHFTGAIESDPKGLGAQTATNGSSADSAGANLTAPVLGKGEEDNKAKEETEKGVEKDNPATKKTKPLEEEEEVKPKPKPKEDKREKENINGSSGGKTLPVGDAGVDQCDPSNRCIDDNSKFVACLRVPGKGIPCLDTHVRVVSEESNNCRYAYSRCSMLGLVWHCI